MGKCYKRIPSEYFMEVFPAEMVGKEVSKSAKVSADRIDQLIDYQDDVSIHLMQVAFNISQQVKHK